MTRLLLTCLASLLVLCEGVAAADVTGVAILSDAPLGTFAGRPYREGSLQLSGRAPGGPYRVPVTIAYPTRPTDANGAALIDVPDATAPAPLAVAQADLGERYLLGTGNVHLSVLWDKAALEAAGTGSLAAATDAAEVLRDTARLARNTGWIPYPAGFDRPPAASRVVAYGYGRPAALLRGFHAGRENTRDGLAFDGTVLAAVASGCARPAAPLAFFPCDGAIADGGKVSVVQTQTDVERGAVAARGETGDYRVIELPGTARLPVPRRDLRALGNPAQNPVGLGPVLRAVHHNLLAWIKGTTPPPSRYLTLRGVQPAAPAADADGNALGGVRLPHMPSLSRGVTRGAPLGAYGGVLHGAGDPLLSDSGTFTPFPDARLRELYPTHERYVERVTRAADRLLARRYLLKPARDAYVRAARRAAVP
jgi:hypothetical protein